MTSYTITLDVPKQVYQRAEHVAQTTEQPVAQVIADWITPPFSTQDEIEPEVIDLARLNDDELIQVARSVVPEADVNRLRDLFVIQREHGLTEAEQQEAAALVEQEDLYTLRKARSLYLLKQRNALPNDLRELLEKMSHDLHPFGYTS